MEEINHFCVTQGPTKNSYNKKIRFSWGTVIRNDLLDFKSVIEDNNLEYCRWGFGFKAPICRDANSWRWCWFKFPSGKINVIRWTLPRIYYG